MSFSEIVRPKYEPQAFKCKRVSRFVSLSLEGFAMTTSTAKLTYSVSEAAAQLGAEPLDVRRLITLGRLKSFTSPNGEKISTAELQKFIDGGAKGLRSVPRQVSELLSAGERDLAGQISTRIRGELQARGKGQTRTVCGRLPVLEMGTGTRFGTGGALLMALQATREIERELRRQLTAESLTAAVPSCRLLYERRERFESVKAAAAKTVLSTSTTATIRTGSEYGGLTATGEAVLTAGAMGGQAALSKVLAELL